MTEVDGETTVFVASTARRVVHTERDCRHLERADVVKSLPRSQFAHLDVCRVCSGSREVDRSNPWRYRQALAEADIEEALDD